MHSKGTTNDVTSSPVTVTVKLNSKTAETVSVGNDGSFNKTLTLTSGTNTIIVVAKDSAGKTTTVTRTVTLDTTAPTIKSVKDYTKSNRLWKNIRDQCRSYRLGDEYGQKSIRKGRWHRSEL